MATRKKAELEPAELIPEEEETDLEPEEIEGPINGKLAADPKDAEIERLKAELAEANRRAAYATPMDERKRVQKAAEDAAKSGADPWQIKIAVRIPRRPPTEDQWYWININGISAQIPANDRVQELKLPWAVALMDMLTAEERAQDYADSLEVKDPVNNPH